MSLSSFRIIAGIVVWGVIFLATLSIGQVQADWGHGICGPWGCGPPLQALIACHLSWLVVLLPLAALIQTTERFTRFVGSMLITFGLIGIVGIIAYELFTWWPSATELHRRYLWQRLGFSIVTLIDLPVIESIITGCFLYVQAASQRIRSRIRHEVSMKTAVTA
jgi:hypothetical protein